MNYIYNKKGYVVAFIENNNVFLTDGTPLGFIRDNRVYDLDGKYIGTYNPDLEMVLIKEGEITSFPKIQTATLTKRVGIVNLVRRVVKEIPIGHKSVFW